MFLRTFNSAHLNNKRADCQVIRDKFAILIGSLRYDSEKLTS
jgi:hypothetical protein